MFFTDWHRRKLEKAERLSDQAEDLIRWGEVSDHPYKKQFFNHIKSTARTEAKEYVDELNLHCEVPREDFNLLLDYLGLEIQKGKRIVKKGTKK